MRARDTAHEEFASWSISLAHLADLITRLCSNERSWIKRYMETWAVHSAPGCAGSGYGSDAVGRAAVLNTLRQAEMAQQSTLNMYAAVALQCAQWLYYVLIQIADWCDTCISVAQRLWCWGHTTSCKSPPSYFRAGKSLSADTGIWELPGECRSNVNYTLRRWQLSKAVYVT